MKKYRKQLLRITSLLCSMVLTVSLVVFPASAAEVVESSFLNVLDYNDYDYLTVTPTNNVFSFSLPNYSVTYYTDIVFSCNGTINALSFQKGTSSSALTIVSLGSSLYRAYGSTPSNGSSTFDLVWDVSGTAWIEILSFDVALFKANHFSDTTSFSVTYGIGSTDVGTTKTATMSAAGSRTQIPFAYGNAEGYYDFHSLVNCADWVKYDFVDIIIQCRVGSIDSIAAYQGDIILPFEVSYLNTDASESLITNDIETWIDSEPDIITVAVRVDLRGLNRTSSTVPVIDIRGTYDITMSNNYFALVSYSGYVTTDTVNPVKIWFDDLKSFLADLFGKDDPAASDALQTQEDLNQSVNTHIAGAVEEWNSNIEVVQTGYDTAFEHSTPALAWLGSLAERIFASMGWFSNIYFFVGITSVFMLILSKSGIAINAIRRHSK